jgi:iron complex outermembrane receptor protein
LILWRKNREGSSEQYACLKSAAEADKGTALWGKVLLLCLLFFPVWGLAQSDPNRVIPFDIPQQRVDEALIQFAEQAGLTFFVPFDQVEGMTSNALIGSYSSQEALGFLLSGSGLQAEISDQGRLSIASNVSSGGESDMNNRNRVSVGILGGLLGFFSFSDSFAQTDGDQEASTSRYAIEEILVSSRRVEEGLQDAPIAVTAISGAELENRGALDVIDFADVAPNVSMKTNGAVSGFAAAPRTSIRGIGQADFVINTDPAVGLYADGVYLGRSIGSVLDLVDVERVEALRGPQGTLFGRNSTGGAINVISKKPEVGADPYGDVTASFGEGGYKLLRASANIPLTDTAALRVSALKRERDGFIPLFNYDNLELGAEDVSGFKAAIRFQPNDSFTLDLDADFSSRTDSAAPIIAVDLGDLSEGETGLDNPSNGRSTSLMARRFNGEPGGPPVSPLVVPYQTTDALCGTDTVYRDQSATCLGGYYSSSRDGSYHTWFDNDGNTIRADDQSLETYGYSARLSWEFDNFTVKTISSWRGFESSFINGSPAPIYVATNANVLFDQDQSSHEINLSGDINDRMSWLAGVFYQTETGREIVEVRYPLVPPANAGVNLPLVNIEDRNIDNSSKAIYAQLSTQISDTLSLTLGARQTEEEKLVYIKKTEFRAVSVALPDGLLIAELEGVRDASEPSLLANLAWELSDDSMAYIQFSDGFRNGGFPARRPAGTTQTLEEASYDEEFVESLEIGFKSTALDGRLRTNLAVFRTDFTDMQINATFFDVGTGSAIGNTANLADVEISGIELEGSYLVNDNFRIDTSIGYLTSDIKSILTANGEFILNANNNLQKTITADSGNVLPHAPELQVNVGANYSLYLGNGAEIRNRLDVFYEAEQYSTIGNYDQGLIPSSTRLNYVATYMPSDANWEATLGIRNLTNQEDILNAALESGPRAGLYNVLGRGREAYLQFKYSFGG